MMPRTIDRRIPSDVLTVLSDPKCLNLTSGSADFWIMARALKDFVDGQGDHGLLPVRGSIPDMFSDSKRYIQLQNIYRHGCYSKNSGKVLHLKLSEI
jgi:amyloid beta precursor protein binding protein 1